MEFEPTVHGYYENGKKVAIIDNTDINRRKVILIDEPISYKQIFFLKCKDSMLVESTRTMRKNGIDSF
jgi:hypothetical protein